MIVAAVLIKGFDAAKQRLAGALLPEQRRRLAEEGAGLALAAAAVADEVLVVAGTVEAGAWARAGSQAHVIVEKHAAGQNAAAAKAVQWAMRVGADALVIISSDLPLITPAAVSDLIAAGQRLAPPAVVAAPAIGRGGTNALYLAPPGVVGLHFGEDSLLKFERDARSRGATFLLHESPELALDLDEPDDLARLPRPLSV